MINSTRALIDWLRSHNIDPDAVSIVLETDETTANRITDALARERTALDQFLVSTYPGLNLERGAKINGMKVRTQKPLTTTAAALEAGERAILSKLGGAGLGSSFDARELAAEVYRAMWQGRFA